MLKTIEKLAVLLVVISVLEFFYFRNIQTNIANIQEQTQEQTNTIGNEIAKGAGEFWQPHVKMGVPILT